MNHKKSPSRSQCSGRAGLTMVEVVICTVLVGSVLVGAMDLLGNVIRGRTDVSNLAKGRELAQQLMTEILSQAYIDDTLPTFGPEPGEVLAVRSAYDDVDDYHSWMSVMPALPDGTPLANTTNWERDVIVEWVDPNDPATVSVTDQGLKRITITVLYDGDVVARLVGLRSDKY